MKNWLWLALIPSLVFAESRPCNLRKDPIYLDVHPDKVLLGSDGEAITPSELTRPGNPLETLLDRIEQSRDTRYPVLVVRPGSAVFQREIRQRIQQRGLEFGIEPLEADQTASREALMEFSLMGAPPPPPANGLWEAYLQVAGKHPCDIEIQADSLTILNGSLVVSKEELLSPGNPFDQLLEQREACADCPCLTFCKGSGSDEWLVQLLGIIQQKAPRLAWHMGIASDSAMILACSPVEARAEGKEPVIFECRNNQVFSILPDRIQTAAVKKLDELKQQAYCDAGQLRHLMTAATLEVDGQWLEFTNAFTAVLSLHPAPDARGFSFDQPAFENDDLWLTGLLQSLNPEKQYVLLFVRPDSFEIFRKVRKMAVWEFRLETSCELLDDHEAIRISPRGNPVATP